MHNITHTQNSTSILSLSEFKHIPKLYSYFRSHVYSNDYILCNSICVVAILPCKRKPLEALNIIHFIRGSDESFTRHTLATSNTAKTANTANTFQFRLNTLLLIDKPFCAKIRNVLNHLAIGNGSVAE